MGKFFETQQGNKTAVIDARDIVFKAKMKVDTFGKGKGLLRFQIRSGQGKVFINLFHFNVLINGTASMPVTDPAFRRGQAARYDLKEGRFSRTIGAKNCVDRKSTRLNSSH